MIARIARRAVFAVDALLRRQLRIFEFSTDPECMLRAAIVAAPRAVELGEGSIIRQGEPVADLHLWNEHVPAVPPGGADLAWLAVFDGRLRGSLAALATYLAHTRSEVRAIRMVATFGRPDADMDRIGRRFGFRIVRDTRARTVGARLHRFFANFLFLALSWAYNPGSLAGKRFRRDHCEYWMSRATLEARYGARAPREQAPLP